MDTFIETTGDSDCVYKQPSTNSEL